jgi:hypothetical protein
MTNIVAQKLSWAGKEGKTAFGKMTLLPVVCG